MGCMTQSTILAVTLPVHMYSPLWCLVLQTSMDCCTQLVPHPSLSISRIRHPSPSAWLFFLVLQIYPGCPPVFHLIRQRRLRFFGHVARADPQQDHRRVTGASRRPPSHWRRPCGRPRTSWLRTITIRYDTRC